MILKKGNKLYSILTGKCPKCHHELMYKNSNAYQLSQTLEMHERCGHCQTKYKIEPSFFYGSMYVSYGVGIGFSMVAFLTTFIFFETSLVTSFIAIVATLIGFMPIIMRLSRNIWINLFMGYDAELAKKK
jgi:prepilin signal peptidase PulO-like enzyme (type II secretory pathway)